MSKPRVLLGQEVFLFKRFTYLYPTILAQRSQ